MNFSGKQVSALLGLVAALGGAGVAIKEFWPSPTHYELSVVREALEEVDSGHDRVDETNARLVALLNEEVCNIQIGGLRKEGRSLRVAISIYELQENVREVTRLREDLLANGSSLEDTKRKCGR